MCKEWNTFVEEKVSTPAAGVSRGSSVAKKNESDCDFIQCINDR